MLVYVKTSSPKTRKQKAKRAKIRAQQIKRSGSRSFVRLERRIQNSLRPGSMDFQNLGSVTGRVTSDETTYQQPPVYTGSKVVGISTMHKSNLVPIFSEDEAADHAKMRR